jgi:membrane protease YdiL (CAAX protease family)
MVFIYIYAYSWNLKTSLIISSVIFGFAHTFSIITLAFFGIDPITILISISFQVIYAILLGLALGYMYIKTKSLLPSIILHYLINTIGLILSNTLNDNIFLQGIFMICFVGLIPAILIVLLVKYVAKTDGNLNFFET